MWTSVWRCAEISDDCLPNCWQAWFWWRAGESFFGPVAGCVETYGPPRLQVIFPMDWSVCVNVSGLRASSRPRWRSARSGSHNSVGDKSAIPHIRFPEHRSTVRPSFFHHPQTSWTGSRSSYQHRSISVTPSHQRLWRQICRRDVRRPTQSVPAYWPMRRLRRSYAPW